MLRRQSEDALDKLSTRHKGLLQKFPLSKIVAAMDGLPAGTPYHVLPAYVKDAWAAALAQEGEASRDAIRRATLLWLIARFEERALAHQYTGAVKERFKLSFGRIIAISSRECPTEYSGNSDSYLKDLAICRQHSFPAGVRIVEQDSGFSRSPLTRNGISQAWAFARFLVRQRGANRHYYQMHTHLLELEDFNPAGWCQCCLVIADMLAINPCVRGVFGCSWFYDPALSHVSPHLSYLREFPTQNGAHLFYSGISPHGGALARSRTRNRLYQEGKYLPKSYLLVWPRDSLMAWADEFRRHSH